MASISGGNPPERSRPRSTSGIDLGSKESQIAVWSASGDVLERRCRTERLGAFLCGRAPGRVIVEFAKLARERRTNAPHAVDGRITDAANLSI